MASTSATAAEAAAQDSGLEVAMRSLARLHSSFRARASSGRRLARRFIPLLLLLSLTVYVLCGAIALRFFEREEHEKSMSSHSNRMTINRRTSARHIRERIFNDTRNMLIIVDREQQERVQQVLIDGLKRYEAALPTRPPNLASWTWTRALGTSLGTLLTVGGVPIKQPATTKGQIFHTFFALIGVPLLFGTLYLLAKKTVEVMLREDDQETILAETTTDDGRRVAVESRTQVSGGTNRPAVVVFAQLVGAVILIWLLVLSFVLYNAQISSLGRSVRTSLLTLFTVHLPENGLSAFYTLVLLTGVFVGLYLVFVEVLLLVHVLRLCSHNVVKVTPTTGRSGQKVTVLVDEAGESHLVQ